LDACAFENIPDLCAEMKKSLTSLALLLALSPAHAADPGKKLFTENCSACHQPLVLLVGPPLAEISRLYRGKEAEFLKWCHNPSPHKRKNLVQMPAMTHVPVAELKQIYEHIMVISKDLKEIEQKTGDPFPDTLARRPMVQRMFLDKTGPASIAVALPGDLNFCWDAGECRLRYLWKGEFLDAYPYWRGNGSSLAKVKGEIFYTETTSPLTIDQPVKFLGYSMKDAIPTFKYRLGGTEVHERIEAIDDGLQRSFVFKNAPSQITLGFQANDQLSYSSKTGSWNGTTLSTPTDAPVVVNIKLIK